jgi:hypothetical protein
MTELSAVREGVPALTAEIGFGAVEQRAVRRGGISVLTLVLVRARSTVSITWSFAIVSLAPQAASSGR